jgi:hypothetical protein
LIIEPHHEVRDLLERVVKRLGNDVLRELGDDGLAGIDACVIEPSAPGGEELVQTLRSAGIPVVCVSIYPPTYAHRLLEPVAYLLKPFALGDLERAVITATAGLDEPGGDGSELRAAEAEGG